MNVPGTRCNMSLDRKGRYSQWWCPGNKGKSSFLTGYAGGAALAFIVCLHILWAFHALLFDSPHFVLQKTSFAKLKFTRSNARDGEDYGFTRWSHSVVLDQKIGLRVAEENYRSQAMRKGSGYGAVGMDLTRLPLEDRELQPSGGGGGPITTLDSWKGDLDGVDLRHLLQNLTGRERQRWLVANLARFKILQSDNISEAFPSRMKHFFNGVDEGACAAAKLSPQPQEHVNLERSGEELKEGEEVEEEGGCVLRISDEGFQFPQAERPQKARSTDAGLGGTRKSKCEARIFTTWIFPLSSFGPREMLSLESIFRTYPRACVVILSRSLDSAKGIKRLKPLRERGFRILAATPDFPFLLKNTSANLWFKQLKKGNVDPGDISLGQNLSNLLRLAALYKYGGAYVDSDIIMLRKFPSLDNVIGSQSVTPLGERWTRINNAVMVFSRGHPVLLQFIEEFALTFNGSRWGHNGPYLVTRVWKRLMMHRGGGGYQCSVLMPPAFYPVDWLRIREFLAAPKVAHESSRQLAKLEKLQTDSYTLHLWNKQSRELAVERGSIVDVIFRQRCVLCNESLLVEALKPQPRT